ncbi:MAG: YceI family protein [Chloroflexi bacterium]|nr:YceI family protein [Chloroflexota bacterium]
MSRNWLRHGLTLVSIAFFAAGCASNAPAPAATAVPAAPTAAPVAPAPTSVSTNSSNTGNTMVRLQVVPDKSEARYRVREQLAQVSLPSDAVGKTSAITGTIVGKTDGTIVAAESKFVVDLRTLRSDRDQRDNFLRREVLQSNQYPNAVFVPTQASGLDLTFPPTKPTTFKLIGDLTIRNVTKPVTWDVTCEPQGNGGMCRATTNFNFAYFNLTQPRVPVVLSVVDNIILELDLQLQRVEG